MQSSTDDEPLGLFALGGHGTGSEDPEGQKWSGIQEAQETDDSFEYEPAGHAFLYPSPSQKNPAGQGMVQEDVEGM